MWRGIVEPQIWDCIALLVRWSEVLTVVESFRLVEPWSEADGWGD
jgi:hypothetical protein